MNEHENPVSPVEADIAVPRWMKIAIAAGVLLVLELENTPVVSLPLSTARDFLLR